MQTDVLIIGGGAAGCTLAARLSEDADRRVYLVEAGPDISEADMPPEISAPYPSRAFFTRKYFYSNLMGQFGDVSGVKDKTRSSARYEQARVLGGGSTINGLVANRGAPSDYDEWLDMGAKGWGWKDVLPYFRKLERDLNFDGPYHGDNGPIVVQRQSRENTSGFIRQAFNVLKARGYPEIADQNGEWQDGVMSPSITIDEKSKRVTTATSYLTPEVRARTNLTILTMAQADRLVFKDGHVTGAEISSQNGKHIVEAGETILCCGAINTPALLMRNGIGPAADLKSLGIKVIKDSSGVGHNLHEHPALGISCFVRPGNRAPVDRHHTQLHLRFSSGQKDCPPSDMKMALLARSAWHAVGGQLATYYLWVNKPYSIGKVSITSGDPADAATIDFRLLSDPRDLERLRKSFRLIADIARDPGFDGVRSEVFPTIYSDRVRKVSRPTWFNALQTGLLATLLDIAGFARKHLIKHLIAPVDLDELLSSDAALDEYFHRAVVGVWHPIGTCRMGRPDDSEAVTDPAGLVYGVPGLRICDASLMPTAVSANTNLPTIMIAERIADLIKQGR